MRAISSSTKPTRRWGERENVVEDARLREGYQLLSGLVCIQTQHVSVGDSCLLITAECRRGGQCDWVSGVLHQHRWRSNCQLPGMLGRRGNLLSGIEPTPANWNSIQPCNWDLEDSISTESRIIPESLNCIQFR